MKKILVPTDFSENAEHAVLVAANLAKQLDGRLILHHCNTVAVYAPVMYPYYTTDMVQYEQYNQFAYEKLMELKQELEGMEAYKQLEIRLAVEEGFIHTAINRVCAEEDVDLIVMGTKGASGLNEFFFGSNTERVIRTATCPVLVIPKGVSAFNPKKIVFASTLKGDNLPAFQFLAKWQNEFGSKIEVLYLNNPAQFESDAEIAIVKNHLVSGSGLKVEEIFTSGNVMDEEKAITVFAEEHGADCVALATHQRKGLARLIFGSLTEDEANHSHIPILAIPI